MYIKRDQLLNKLIRYRKKDIVKVITGIRRCGKSVLLNELFYEYLLSDGVPSDHIIKVSLDLKKWEALRNGETLYHYIADRIESGVDGGAGAGENPLIKGNDIRSVTASFPVQASQSAILRMGV